MFPYKCDARYADGKKCGNKASAVFYCKDVFGWFYLCNSHRYTINQYAPDVRETLEELTEERERDLMWRSLPRGEDR